MLPLAQKPNKHPVESRSHIPCVFILLGHRKHTLYSYWTSVCTQVFHVDTSAAVDVY